MNQQPKKYTYLLWFQLIAFSMVIGVGLYHMLTGFGIPGWSDTTSNQVLSSKIVKYSIFFFIWRLAICVTLKRKLPVAPWLLTTDFLLLIIPFTTVISMSIALIPLYNLFDLLKIPSIIVYVLVIGVTGVSTLFGWQIKSVFQKRTI